jgi:hypothetical protein
MLASNGTLRKRARREVAAAVLPEVAISKPEVNDMAKGKTFWGAVAAAVLAAGAALLKFFGG